MFVRSLVGSGMTGSASVNRQQILKENLLEARNASDRRNEKGRLGLT